SKGQLIALYPNRLLHRDYTDISLISNEDREALFSVCREWNEFISPENIVKVSTTAINKDYSQTSTPWSDFDAKNDVLTVVSDDFAIVRETKDYIFIKRTNGETNSQQSGKVFKDTGLLYLHSTSTIYPANKGITPSAAYAYKYHNGDFSKAMKDLYDQGFGDRKEEALVHLQKTSDDTKKEFPYDIFSDEVQNFIKDSH